MMVTLAPTRIPVLPEVVQTADPLFKLDREKGLYVDCLAEDVLPVLRLVRHHLAGLSVRWMDPCRSLGSSSSVRRAVLRGFFPARMATTLDLRALLHQLRALHLPASALLAVDDIFGDSAALLLELSSPEVAPLFAPLCEELAFINPKRLTVRTLASPEVWKQKLDALFAEDPSHCGLRLRWRSSRMGGRIFAQPAATQRQLDACGREARREVAPCSAAFPRQVCVQTNGPVGFDGTLVVHGLLKHLAGHGFAFTPARDDAPVCAGQWEALQALQGPHMNGRLRLAVGSAVEVDRILDLLHEKAIAVGSDVVTITATEDGVQKSRAKHCQRGGAQVRPPPAATST